MHYYQFNIGDFSLHTNHLTLEEEAVYRRLLDFYYDTELPIPIETHPVIRRLRLGLYEPTVDVILHEFFVKESDGWHNLRADIEIADYHAKGKTARENGSKGGRPKKNSGSKTQSVILANPQITQTKAKQELETVNSNNKQITIRKKAFIKPTLEEVTKEFSGRVWEAGQSSDWAAAEQAERWLNHYESNGFMVGRNKMKSWRHCVTGWIKRNESYGKDRKGYPTKSEKADAAAAAALEVIAARL